MVYPAMPSSRLCDSVALLRPKLRRSSDLAPDLIAEPLTTASDHLIPSHLEPLLADAVNFVSHRHRPRSGLCCGCQDRDFRMRRSDDGGRSLAIRGCRRDRPIGEGLPKTPSSSYVTILATPFIQSSLTTLDICETSSAPSTDRVMKRPSLSACQ